MTGPLRTDPASHDRAPSHRKPPMPKAADIAHLLRTGTPLATICADLERAPETIKTKLTRAGYTSRGEWADDTTPTPILLPLLHPFDDQPWAADALCRTSDPELFYGGKGTSPRAAKEICNQCIPRELCAEYALTNDERWGVWGALTAHERLMILRERRRGPAGGDVA